MFLLILFVFRSILSLILSLFLFLFFFLLFLFHLNLFNSMLHTHLLALTPPLNLIILI